MLTRKSQTDVITYAVILFTFAVGTFIALIVFNEFYDAFPDATGEVKQILDNQEYTFIVLDYSFLFLNVGLIIALFISGYKIQSSKIYLVLSIILMFVDVIVGVALSNAYQLMGAQFISTNASLPVISFFINSIGFPLMMILSAVVFYVGFYTSPMEVRGYAFR